MPSSMHEWAEADRIGYMINTRNTEPRIVGVYRIDRVSGRYATAIRTSKTNQGRRDTFRLLDGRVKGASEYSDEALYPADHVLVARAQRGMRIRRATADLVGLLNDKDVIPRLTGSDYDTAIALAEQIIQTAAITLGTLRAQKATTPPAGDQ